MSTQAALGKVDLEWTESTRTLSVKVENIEVMTITRGTIAISAALDAALAALDLTGQTRGDVIRYGASAWERHAAKASGQILVGDGTDVLSVAVSGDATLSAAGALIVTDVTVGSDAAGDLLYKSSATALARLAKGTGLQVLRMNSGATAPEWGAVDNELALAKPRVRCVQETVTAASLTDGGSNVGTKTLEAAIPAGARYLFTTCTGLVGFAGDTSAVMIIGDGDDTDRYLTGTPDLFTTAAAGVDLGVASGVAFHADAKTVSIAVSSAADISLVIAGAGSVDLQFWFLEPI